MGWTCPESSSSLSQLEPWEGPVGGSGVEGGGRSRVGWSLGWQVVGGMLVSGMLGQASGDWGAGPYPTPGQPFSEWAMMPLVAWAGFQGLLCGLSCEGTQLGSRQAWGASALQGGSHLACASSQRPNPRHTP